MSPLRLKSAKSRITVSREEPIVSAICSWHHELESRDIPNSLNRRLYLPSGHTTTGPVGWSVVVRVRRGFLVAGFASADTRPSLRGFDLVPVASNKNCWRHGLNPSLGAQPRSGRL